MNEIQRQQYLDALGIDSYMPRWILPVAPAPFSCAPVLPKQELPKPGLSQPELSQPGLSQSELPRAESPAVADSGIAPSVQPSDAAHASPAPSSESVASSVAGSESRAAMQPEGNRASAAGVSGTLSEIVEEVKTSTAAARPVSESANAATVQQKEQEEVDPSFSLSLWRVSDDLVVVDSRHAELALPTEPLLTNILMALGMPRQPLSRAEVLRWPMYDHRLAPKGEAAARETVMAMLEGKLEAQPARYILLMGAEACHFVLPAELLPAEGGREASYQTLQGKTHAIEDLGLTAIVVPSLCQMLQQPELKALTWQAIQPLRVS